MDDTSRRVEREEEVARRAAISGDEPEHRVEVIRAEIEQTREDMSETIDAIQERLRPRNIAAEATGRVKTATTERMKNMAHTAGETAQEMMQQTRDVAGRVTRSARENPLPAILIGIGTAWLLMNRSESTRGPRFTSRREWDANRRIAEGYALGPGEVHDYGGYGVYYDEAEHEGFAERIMEKIRHHPIPAALAGAGLAWLAFANGRDRSGGEYDYGYEYEGTYGTGDRYGTARSSRAAQNVRGAYGEAAEAAGNVADEARELTSRAQHYAGEAADEIRWRGRRAQNQLQRMLYQNPLMVGAAAVVLGAAVGMALPETEREREWMGDTRDTLMDRAQEMAKNAASRVQEAAGDVAGDIASRAVSGKDE